MSHEIITLGEYEGTAIQCRPSDDYVNATQMCKAAGKLWGNYWQNQEAKDFVGCLSSHIGIPICDLVWSSRARLDNGGGTWVHRRVATHLAQWCSPDFAVWVSGQIEAIMDEFHRLLSEHGDAGQLLLPLTETGTTPSILIEDPG